MGAARDAIKIRMNVRVYPGQKISDSPPIHQAPIEAIGILEELQVSPNLNESEKKIVKDVSERIGGLMKYALNRYSSIRADIYEQKKPEQASSFEQKKLSGNR